MADETGEGGSNDRHQMLVDLLERIVVSGVALTAHAVGTATGGQDLTIPQWRVLVVLGDGGDRGGSGVRLSDVAARVGVTLPATSRQLRRLERRGLVELLPDQQDKRAVRAHLTPDGQRVRATIVGYRMNAIADATAGKPVDQHTLSQLAGVVAALDRFR